MESTNNDLEFSIAKSLITVSSSQKSWNSALDKIATYFHASAIQLQVISNKTKKTILDIEVGSDLPDMKNWSGLNNTLTKTIIPFNASENSHKTIEVCILETDCKSTFFAPSCHKVPSVPGIEHAFVVVLTLPSFNVTAILGIIRADKDRMFTPEDFDKFTRIKLLFQSAVKNFVRDYRNELKVQSFQGIIDREHLGIIIVNDHSHFMMSNDVAANIVKTQTLFCMSPKRELIACDPEIEEKLNSYINKVMSTQSLSQDEPGDLFLRVKNKPHANGYVLVARPIHINIDGSKQDRLVLIQIIDLNKDWQLEQEHLRKALQITTTEASVLKLLAEGQSLKEIATLKQRSYHTIRNHIQSVMNKTGLHRQTDLILLVYSVILTGRSTKIDNLQNGNVILK